MKKTNKISYIQTSKINFLSILLLLFVVTTKAQTPYNQYLTPNGVLENVFDQNGNRYQLRDLIVSNQIDLASNKSVLVSCSSTSIFNLYFEPGCGMTSTTNLTEINRRTVLCQVFQDISNFINTPLTTTNKKVNIWVRNINNITGVNMNATLGLASGFYLLPPSNLNSASVQGGIADNELWKTIHTGQDSYTNVAPPLIINSPNNNDSGAYYHGMVALNFNTTASNVPLFNWYTTPLTAVALVGSNDLYSVILHEVTHALGFGSLIDQNGNSRFEPNFKFYSRYDKFLKNNANTQFLLPNTVGTSSMYNTTFNSNTAAITPAVIRPSCATSGFINTGNPVDMTTCTSALRFVSSTLNVPVYTPICYERGSSLSHFEDQCVAPNVNNAYFVMSNAAGSGANNTKRYLKPQERSALCDLGYSVKPTFGSSAVRLTATALGPFNYGGTGSCLGITVAGTNDGITYTAATNTSTYTYIGVINTSISIPCSGLLANDTNATGLEYLEDLTTGTVLLTSGTNTSIATLYTGILGVHLLRYVPTNGTQKGNITYVYVYLTSDASCTSANACNLVLNGGFEQFSSLPTNLAQISNACGWNSATGTVDYFNTNATNLSYVQIPCNFSGNQASNNSIGNGYAGLYARLNQNNNPNSNYSEVIYTRLASPLVAGVKYQLRFDVALSDGYSSARPILQAYFSSADLFSINPVLNLPSGAMPISDLTYHNNFAGWDTITLTYTATGGEIFLYIGTINNFTTQTTSLVIPNPGCTLTQYPTIPVSYYLLDNVSLVAAALDLPATWCRSEPIKNLATGLSTGTPTTGVFSGPGVTLDSITGVYYFYFPNGIREATITYTYTNNLGCSIVLQDTITVEEVVTPIFPTLPAVLCQNATAPLLPTSSSNVPPITGTWSPATVSNTSNGNYLFTPTAGQCATGLAVPVRVLASNAFVANPDVFNTLYPVATLTTGSVRTNDTYYGGSIPAVISQIPYSIVLTGTLPTFAVGGISFAQTTGVFTIQANTTPGTYNYSYYTHNNCFDTPVVNVQIKINEYVASTSKIGYDYCYPVATASGFTNPTSLFNAASIQGVPASASNATINYGIQQPYPASILTINPDGTLTIAPNVLPGNYGFTYKICSGSYCSESINCSVNVISPIRNIGNNDITATPVFGTVNFNVLSRNEKYVCGTGYVPTTVGAGGNVVLYPVPTIGNNPYAIDPASGFIVVIGTPSPGAYFLGYKICDLAYPDICLTVYVRVLLPAARGVAGVPSSTTTENMNLEKTTVSPNPTSDIVNILFHNPTTTNMTLALYDPIGRLLTQQLIVKETQDYVLDMSHYSVGNYFVKIIDAAGKAVTLKIIKQ